MICRLIFLILMLVAPAVSAAEDRAELFDNARGLVCADEPLDGEAMAAALSPVARLVSDQPMEMGGRKFGWRRRFALGDGAVLDITRIGAGGGVRRIDIQLTIGERPEVMAVLDNACALVRFRRIIYDRSGRAESIEILDADFTPTGDVELLNPPVPPGIDPGGVTVALIDAGVNYLLPVINARLARDKDGGLLGYDYWDMDDRPFDANPARSPFFPQRHGTRVASVILAEAPGVRLIPYRYPRPDLSRMAALVRHAAANGARIVNLAMGSNKPGPWRAFAAAMAENPDILFVVSAGNDDRNLDRRPVYPAAFKAENMLVISSADGFGEPAPRSNWGKGTVDLLVPGERVAVIDFHGRPGTASGASFAVPRVTALAARLLAKNPDWTATDLKAAIISRARLIDGSGRLTTRYGSLDLEALHR